jgi:hypothetical protein
MVFLEICLLGILNTFLDGPGGGSWPGHPAIEPDRRTSHLTLANRPHSIHTPGMKLKNTALLALVGMSLAAILLVAGFIEDVFEVARGLIPAMDC